MVIGHRALRYGHGGGGEPGLDGYEKPPNALRQSVTSEMLIF